MEKAYVEDYLNRVGVSLEQRVEKHSGGQYLTNFLLGFGEHVRQHTLNKAISSLKEQR